eukprot:2813953-Amphidinium_carterae.1
MVPCKLVFDSPLLERSVLEAKAAKLAAAKAEGTYLTKAFKLLASCANPWGVAPQNDSTVAMD